VAAGRPGPGAEILDRILAATRHCTTILISHRFSTVRHADRICVLEGGRVTVLGSHADLVARGGQYAELYGIQAAAYRDPSVGPTG
jgi:ATP-binding cassette, subfamily B, bacterial